MWSDRETIDDLLGFHLLVESLMTLLTEPRLVPVTIGLDGDWGSGKSSLLKMAAARLDDKYVAVTFSPWMHEDYDDIKVALITSVLRTLRDQAPVEATPRINAIMRVVRELAKVARFGRGLLPTALTAVATSQGVDPAQASAMGAAVAEATDHAIDALMKPETAEPDEDLDPSMLVAEFRHQFRALMQELEAEVAGVVVFIDDVDRCLPEAVVDTFEAIRLFSDIEGTAFVVAAHRSMVEAAIDARYARLNYGEMPHGALGNNYLEKMWHITLRVPPLSPPEVETYLNLLLCELHLDSERMDRLRAWVRERNPSTMLTALNQGTIEAEIGGDLPGELARDLEWVSNIAHAAAEGLRGNPRQVKRFVNRLRLYSRTLGHAGQSVDHAVLAKLLLLDEVDPNGFATLMRWTIAQAGTPAELAAAEDPEKGDDDHEEPLDDWLKRDAVEMWLGLEPPLAGRDLLPYVHVARERASAGGAASRLTPTLQGLLKRLGSKSRGIRRAAVADVQKLGPTEADLIKSALLDVVPRAPRAHTTDSALQLATTDSDFLPALVEALKATDKRKVHFRLPMAVASALSTHAKAIVPLLEAWTAGTSDETARAANVALRRITDREQS